MCIAETHAAGEVVRARLEVRRDLAQGIDRGRLQAGAGAPPPVTAEGIVGGIAEILHARLLARHTGQPQVEDLLAPLMSMIVLPYLGARAATREFTVRAAKTRRAARLTQVSAPSPAAARRARL
ncbi:MAG TPA: hypothetical protein VGY13_06835 [Solirubrobacteraceae bacterium]|nr:hypothetical protein [Solirubrobacteraceae bacterium]